MTVHYENLEALAWLFYHHWHTPLDIGSVYEDCVHWPGKPERREPSRREPPIFEDAPQPRCRVNDADGIRCIRPQYHSGLHQRFRDADQ